MESFNSIDDLINNILTCNMVTEDIENYKQIIDENTDTLEILRTLENVRPCDQRYFLYKRVILITYNYRRELVKLPGNLSIKMNIRVIGLPVDLSYGGYLMAQDDINISNSIGQLLKEAADQIRNQFKGVTLVLNSDKDIWKGYTEASAYIFYNRFSSFQDYLDSMRNRYRYSMVKKLKKAEGLVFRKLNNSDFSEEYYDLYLSVYNRASEKLDPMPLDFFRKLSSDIFEVRDKENDLLGFIQTKKIGKDLHGIYVGFLKDKADECVSEYISSVDLYYNLFLYIIRYGIEQGFEKIVFGATGEETKSMIGCREELRYLYVTSSNPLYRLFFHLYPSFYIWPRYTKEHAVFKDLPLEVVQKADL